MKETVGLYGSLGLGERGMLLLFSCLFLRNLENDFYLEYIYTCKYMYIHVCSLTRRMEMKKG